jgi:hypothetical protein
MAIGDLSLWEILTPIQPINLAWLVTPDTQPGWLRIIAESSDTFLIKNLQRPYGSSHIRAPRSMPSDYSNGCSGPEKSIAIETNYAGELFPSQDHFLD